MHICIYAYMHMYVYVYIYIYIYTHYIHIHVYYADPICTFPSRALMRSKAVSSGRTTFATAGVDQYNEYILLSNKRK